LDLCAAWRGLLDGVYSDGGFAPCCAVPSRTAPGHRSARAGGSTQSPFAWSAPTPGASLDLWILDPSSWIHLDPWMGGMGEEGEGGPGTVSSQESSLRMAAGWTGRYPPATRAGFT